MVQFVRESLENMSNKKLKLKSSKTVKFVNIIDPRKQKELVLEIKANYTESGLIEVKASIKNETTNFFQMRGCFF